MASPEFAALRRRLAGLKPGMAELLACADGLAALARQAQQEGAPMLRVAVAGDLSCELLARAVACALAQEGELAAVHAAPYGTAQQACLDPASSLHKFRPDLVLLVPDWRQAVPAMPVGATPEEVDAALQAQRRVFEAMWSALDNQGCRILQHTLVPPPSEGRGPAERRLPASVGRRVQALNDSLLAAGQGRVGWIETDRLAAQAGLAAWSAPRYFHAGKLGFDPRFLPDYLPWFRGAWRAALGRGKKALVLDLDGTLWGGTLGDDGVEGIALGPAHGPTGEAFAAWQTHLAALAQRGVVLAVCSKNAPTIAASGFDHAASALRHDGFAAFACSWDDKATGLRRVAAELGLGLDALVFVDDNPAERELVQQQLPEVSVVDLGSDPVQFIERLEAGHWFDLDTYTDADTARSSAYAGRRQAQEAREGAIDLDAYLSGLQMVGRLAPAVETDLPRLAQLEGKTNQFNLCTRRHTQQQLAAHLAGKDSLLLVMRLRDRFTDHGLVGSLLALREGDAFRIDSWLLSCRVFSRTAEAFILAGLARMARAAGANALVGEYLPSERNGVVADLYARLGFSACDDQGRWWRLALTGVSAQPTSAIAAADAP